MSGRYYVTGVQLGMIQALIKTGKTNVEKLVNQIINKQFIGDYPTDKDKKRFLKQVKKIQIDNLAENQQKQIKLKNGGKNAKKESYKKETCE